LYEVFGVPKDYLRAQYQGANCRPAIASSIAVANISLEQRCEPTENRKILRAHVGNISPSGENSTEGLGIQLLYQGPTIDRRKR
jgi:hypothetical protein